jgi:hypothetical protein
VSEADATRVIEELERLLFAVARATQARRRADPAKISAAEPNPIEIALAQHACI